jgi:tripartite-type tricarboxylate transporter receptor subunit TctC
VEADAWNGLIAPAGTPRPIIDRISKDVAEIIRQPRARMDSEIERWAPVIKAAKVTLN